MTENQIEKLERIKSLFESGTISKEEMEKLKNDILSNQNTHKLSSSLKVGIKRKYLFILGCILLLISVVLIFLNKYKLAFSDEQKNDLTELGLKGNVKSVLIKHDGQFYEANGFNKEGFLLYRKQGYSAEFTMNYKRDSDNKLNEIEAVRFATDGKTIDRNKTKYYYDSKNKLKKVEEYPFGMNKNTQNYIYNSRGILSEIVFKYSDGSISQKIKFKYDKNDSIIDKIDTRFEEYGIFVSRNSFSYDIEGRIIKDVEFNTNDESTIVHKYEYVYDKNGRKIEKIYSDNGGLVSRNKYIYNESGNLISEKYVYGDGIEILTEYTYDEHSNWIRKNIVDEDGTVTIETRIIQYYSDDELKSNNYFDFNSEFKNMSAPSQVIVEAENELLSYGEIRGRLIGGNSLMVERELGEPAYKTDATSFIEDKYSMSLPIGLYDLCLSYQVYLYESYFGESQHLLVILSNDGKVTNVMPEADVQDVKDICCCD
jgi:hypothetical protein